MRRGEIRIVDLEPLRGNESNKRRPAVLVSNDGANRAAANLGRGVVTVVPVSSNVQRVYPFQVRLAAGTGGLAHDSKAQAEQVRSIDATRVGELLGRLPAAAMSEIDDALRIHLAL
jgi:mRNA interferase MazF